MTQRVPVTYHMDGNNINTTMLISDQIPDFIAPWQIEGNLQAYRRGDTQIPEPEVTWLEEAQAIVQGPRNKSYGHALINFLDLAIRDSMNKIRRGKLPYGKAIDIEDIILFFETHKLVREAQGHEDDNQRDLFGYGFSHQRIDEAMKFFGFEEGVAWFNGKRVWHLMWLFEELNQSHGIEE